jgi:hypothetical protein
MTDQEKRVEIINQIITEIASRGRKFFNHNGRIAKLKLVGRSVYYEREWIPESRVVPAYILVSGKSKKAFELFHHGGTLKNLIKNFAEYIITGTAGDELRGSLYNPHWGYDPEDMAAIQAKAKELGYIN